MEPDETITELAARYAQEDGDEAARVRFAIRADRQYRATGRFPGGDTAPYWLPVREAA